MPVISIIITLVVVGVAMWAVNTFIPMARPIKSILNIIVVVIVCLWLLQTFGIIDSIGGIRFQ